jgi:hypothetical protein
MPAPVSVKRRIDMARRDAISAHIFAAVDDHVSRHAVFTNWAITPYMSPAVTPLPEVIFKELE